MNGRGSRTKGFEVYLTIPMEPVNYPQNDPGPFSLLTARTTRENINLLKSSLARFSGYVGVINHMGSRFTASADSIRPVLAELNRRGLMFIDSRSTQYSVAATMSRAIGMPTAINNRNLDEVLSETEIMNQLQELGKARHGPRRFTWPCPCIPSYHSRDQQMGKIHLLIRVFCLCL